MQKDDDVIDRAADHTELIARARAAYTLDRRTGGRPFWMCGGGDATLLTALDEPLHARRYRGTFGAGSAVLIGGR